MMLRDDLERLAVALEARLEPSGVDFVAKHLRNLASRLPATLDRDALGKAAMIANGGMAGQWKPSPRANADNTRRHRDMQEHWCRVAEGVVTAYLSVVRCDEAEKPVESVVYNALLDDVQQHFSVQASEPIIAKHAAADVLGCDPSRISLQVDPTAKPAEPAPVGSLLGLPDLAESLHGLARVLENARPDAVRFVPFDLRTIADRLDGKSTAAPAKPEPAPAPAPLAGATLEAAALLRRLALRLDPSRAQKGLEKPLEHWLWSEKEAASKEAQRLADRLAESVPGGAEKDGGDRTCRRCQREYTPEPDDLGICCICFRDLAFHRVFGDDWPNIAKTVAEMANAPALTFAGKVRGLISELHFRRRSVALSGAAASGEGEGRIEAVFAEVAAWARATFQDQTAVSIAEHLRREAQELVVNPTDAEELADVLMLAADLADLLGVNPAEIMARKLAECRARKWGAPDAQGVHEHVRAAPSATPRRCIACNLLNPGSDVCPATESGKHVYEADGEGVDDEPAIATCPEVAELKEVIRAIAKEAAREEVASALARLMKPAPEEHVAPDTSGTRRKP